MEYNRYNTKQCNRCQTFIIVLTCSLNPLTSEYLRVTTSTDNAGKVVILSPVRLHSNQLLNTVAYLPSYCPSRSRCLEAVMVGSAGSERRCIMLSTFLSFFSFYFFFISVVLFPFLFLFLFHIPRCLLRLRDDKP